MRLDLLAFPPCPCSDIIQWDTCKDGLDLFFRPVIVFDIRGCLTNDIQVTPRTCSALSHWVHFLFNSAKFDTKLLTHLWNENTWTSGKHVDQPRTPGRVVGTLFWKRAHTTDRQRLAQSHMTKHTFTGVSLDCILLHICFYLNCFWKTFMMMSQPKATVSFDQFIIQWKMCRVPHAEARTRGPTVFNALILSSSGDLI